jgi:glycosyltransferase involved in cell wall biosynthesis
MTAAGAPEASVVIAAFNAEATIDDQLGALARQRLTFPFEVLVCDNGSTDATVDRAEAWTDRLPVRVVDASGRPGAAAARNAGAALARAPRLAFCDADDIVADDWLAELVSGLTDADLVGGGSGYARLNPPALGRQDWEDPLLRTPRAPGLVATSSSNLGIRTAVFRQIGGFDEALTAAEDFDLCWRVQFAGFRVAGRPSAFVDLRRRTTWRGVFRQAFSWGAGDRALQRKYGNLSGYRPAHAASPLAQPWPPPSAEPRPDGVFAKLRRLRGPRDLDFLVARAGLALGTRFGRVDPRIRFVGVEGAPR